MNLLSESIKRASYTIHAIKLQRRQTVQKDRGKTLLSLSLPPSPSSLLSDTEDVRGFSLQNLALRTRATSTWFQVACRGYRARTSSLPGGTRTFRVHPLLLPSTFFPVPHTPSPVPFRHNNRAVSQRVFNGRRLHATKPQAGPPRPPPRRVAPTLLFFLFLLLFFFPVPLFLRASLFLARHCDRESFFVLFPHLSAVLIFPSFSSYVPSATVSVRSLFLQRLAMVMSLRTRENKRRQILKKVSCRGLN